MLTLLYLILILGLLIFVHEFGHFIAAKSIGVYVSEFALGMGPKIFSFKRKKHNDPTEYSLRLLVLVSYFYLFQLFFIKLRINIRLMMHLDYLDFYF